jgi:outer membrane protein assembly factor BamB
VPLHRDDPKSVGGYKLVDRLGAGGMGIVYRGRSRSGREVAVKVVHAQYAEDAVFRTRFRQEIGAARRVSGAFTAPVLDADAEAARPWMATQYVPGRSLAQRIRDRGPLRGAELRGLALGLVEALGDIHRAGVVHRDLKPANVLMAQDGPRVIDFGISRAAENHSLTETGQMIGTPPFMSPEQFSDARSVGPPSDVFSLGALLVYATTGRGPFDADSPYLTAYRVVHDAPVLDGVPEPLRDVLERCLAKEPADRPELNDLARDFATVLPDTGGATGDPPTVMLRPETHRTPRIHKTQDTRDAVTARSGTAAPGRRIRLRPLWAATGTVGALVLGLTAYLLTGPERTDSTEDQEAASRTSRWAAPPTGWQPWRTTVSEPASRGAEKALDTHGGADGGPDCLAYEDDVYCAGDRLLPVRLDGRTGATLWRADIAPSGVDGSAYSTELLGVRDGTLLVRQVVTGASVEADRSGVVALDTASGGRLWTRTVREEFAEAAFSNGLVVAADGDGRSVVARSPRTGAERWRARLPADHYCSFAEAGTGLYAQCVPTTGELTQESVMLALDPADGSTRRLAGTYSGGLLGALDGRLLFLQTGENEDPLTADLPYTRVLRVDPGTGDRSTTKLTEEYRGQVTLADGTIWFAGADGEVVAVSPRTGAPLWRTRTSLEQPGLVRHDPRARAVYAASASGRVAALDANRGTLLWETMPRVALATRSGWPETEPLLSDGVLVVATPDGTVFSLDPAHPDRKPVAG